MSARIIQYFEERRVLWSSSKECQVHHGQSVFQSQTKGHAGTFSDDNPPSCSVKNLQLSRTCMGVFLQVRISFFYDAEELAGCHCVCNDVRLAGMCYWPCSAISDSSNKKQQEITADLPHPSCHQLNHLPSGEKLGSNMTTSCLLSVCSLSNVMPAWNSEDIKIPHKTHSNMKHSSC